MPHPAKRSIRDDSGAATIIEYTIVLPITMAVICILLFTGYLVYERAALESAAERTALYVVKMVEDQNYEELTTASTGANEIDSISFDGVEIETEPYRYLFQDENSIEEIASQAEKIATSCVSEAQIFGKNDVDITAKVSSGVFQTVTVTITEDYSIPSFLGIVELPSIVTIETECVVYVNEPAEFIRNADYMVDIVEAVADATGITDKLNEVVSKLSFFKDKTGQ